MGRPEAAPFFRVPQHCPAPIARTQSIPTCLRPVCAQQLGTGPFLGALPRNQTAARLFVGGLSAALPFSALYVIYIVAQNLPDLYWKVQPIDIGLTEY